MGVWEENRKVKAQAEMQQEENKETRKPAWMH